LIQASEKRDYSLPAGPEDKKWLTLKSFFLKSGFHSGAQLIELKREPRENRGWARRCDRGRNPQKATDSV